MIAQSLKQAIFVMEQDQKLNPLTYIGMEAELDCLKYHMEQVARFINPSNTEDLSISLPISTDNIEEMSA